MVLRNKRRGSRSKRNALGRITRESFNRILGFQMDEKDFAMVDKKS